MHIIKINQQIRKQKILFHFLRYQRRICKLILTSFTLPTKEMFAIIELYRVLGKRGTKSYTYQQVANQTLLPLWNFTKKCWFLRYLMKTFRPTSSRLFQITQQVDFLLTYLLLFIFHCDTTLATWLCTSFPWHPEYHRSIDYIGISV